MPSLEATWRRHAEAVVAGDAATVAADFTPAGMAKALATEAEPQPGRLTAYQVRSAGEHQVEIAYLGDVTRTMRTTWQETQPGTWQIIDIVEVAN